MMKLHPPAHRTAIHKKRQYIDEGKFAPREQVTPTDEEQGNIFECQ